MLGISLEFYALETTFNCGYNFVTIVELSLVGANLFMLVNYEPYLFACMIDVFYYMKKHVVLKDPRGKLLNEIIS